MLEAVGASLIDGSGAIVSPKIEVRYGTEAITQRELSGCLWCWRWDFHDTVNMEPQVEGTNRIMRLLRQHHTKSVTAKWLFLAGETVDL